MAQIGKWNGHKFVVKSNKIESFSDLSITSSSETKDKKSGKQKYVKRQNSAPAEVSLTIKLNKFTGVKVRTEAMAFIKEARKGGSGYFYIDGKKLMKCKLMLIKANVKEVEIAHDGTWISADVDLTLKQCSKFGKQSSSKKSNKKSKKASTKTKSVKTSKGGSGGSSSSRSYSSTSSKSSSSSGTKKQSGSTKHSYVFGISQARVKSVVQNSKLNRKKNVKIFGSGSTYTAARNSRASKVTTKSAVNTKKHWQS